MKKKLGVLAFAGIMSLSLSGCFIFQPAEEEKPNEAPTASQTQSSSSPESSEEEIDVTPPVETIIPEEETYTGPVATDSSVGDKKTIDTVKMEVERAAVAMDLNKVDGKYQEWLYGYGPADNGSKVMLERTMSSPESFCILGSSWANEEIVVLYDSQINGIVKEGQSCQTPEGDAWEGPLYATDEPDFNGRSIT